MRGWMGLLAVLAAAGVGAQVYFSPDTGSHYEVIRTPVTWKAANDLAQARSYNGRPGHLASVTSLAEHQFLLTIGDLNGLWIGGIQKPGSSTSAGWNWTTAEVSNFTRWNPGEPNDLSGTSEDESHTEYAANGSGGFGWNDVSASRVNPGLIVEYSGNSAVRYSPSTGSWYQIVQQPGITLAQARQAAATRSYFGHAGRLATITTPFENRFVNFMGDLDRMWIGLSQPNSASASLEDWIWDGGETFVYSNWDIGQPNNAGGNEGGLTYFGGWAGNRRWHDWGATSTNTRGVLIEFQGPKPDQRLVSWGAGSYEVFPAGGLRDWYYKVPVAHGTRVDSPILDVASNERVVLAADLDGNVWSWGSVGGENNPIGRKTDTYRPAIIPMPKRMAKVDADWQFEVSVLGEVLSPILSSALSVDRLLFIWGDLPGQRRLDGLSSRVPALATIPGPFLDYQMGTRHYAAIQLSDGTAWSIENSSPVRLAPESSPFVGIRSDGVAQESASFGEIRDWYTATGAVSASGEFHFANYLGGVGTLLAEPSAGSDIVQVCGSDPWSALMLRSDGAVLQRGNVVLGLPPIAIIGARTQTFRGSYFAVDFDGVLWAWGYNFSGELSLGPGFANEVLIPTKVSRLFNLVSIFPGAENAKDYPYIFGQSSFAYGSWLNDSPIAAGETLEAILAGYDEYDGVAGNDRDEAGVIEWELISGPAHMESFTFDNRGNIAFRANKNFSGMDSFTYRVTDGFLQSSTVTCLIPVTANLPPVANPDTVQAERGLLTRFDSLLNNDTDPENRLNSWLEVVIPPSKAESFSSSDSRVIYKSIPTAQGTDTFTYRCTDGVHWSAPTTVTIQITEPDFRKVAISDRFQIPHDIASFPAPGVFFNDLIGEPVLEVQSEQGLNVQLDGSFTFTPSFGSSLEWNGRYSYGSRYRFRTTSGWSEWADVSFETTPYYTTAYPDVFIHDVNKGGGAAGFQQLPTRRVPWHRSRTLEGTDFSAEVYGVNDHDLCVGEAVFELSNNNRPVQWGPDGKIVDLGTLGGPIGIANDVDEDGTIVGWAEDRFGQAWATTWKDGKIAKIPGVSPDSEAISIDSEFIYLIEELANGTLVPKVYQRSNSFDRPAGLYNVALPVSATGVVVRNKQWGLVMPTLSDPQFTVAGIFYYYGGELRLESVSLDPSGKYRPLTPSLPGSWFDRQGTRHASGFGPLTPILNYVYQWQSHNFKWEEITGGDGLHFAVNGRLGTQMVSAVISPEATPLGDPGFSRGRGIGDVSISSAQGARATVVEGGQSFYLQYSSGEAREFVTFTVVQGGSVLNLQENSFSIENQDFPVRIGTLPVSQPVTVELSYYNSRPDGGSGTEIFTVVPALPVAALSLDLPDFGGDPETRSFTLAVVRNGSTVLEAPVDFGYNLVAVQKLALTDGVYDFVLKGTHWLSRRLSGVQVESGKTSRVSFALINGDADGDNAITVFDYIALSLSFGLRSDDAGFDQNADFDGDGEVTIFDYILLSQNFDLQGD